MKISKRKKFLVPAGRFRLELGKRTLLMGIINLTSDSFSQDGLLKGKFNRSWLVKKALALARQMVSEGVDILDIGAESSRPGVSPIKVRQELERIVPVVKALSKEINRPISVDTYKPEVALAAVANGASIINNILGTHAQFNKPLAQIAKRHNCALVIMHIRGRPENMQQFTKYRSLIVDISKELAGGIKTATQAGLDFKNIIIDPGIGFAKTLAGNLEIINRLTELALLNRPILIGPSRKSFIGKVLNLEAGERIFGTAAATSAAICAGAHIVRVHDVKQMKQVAQICDAILNYKGHKNV